MAVTIDVLANDADLDGDSLVFTISAPPNNGAETVSNSKIVYLPAPGFVRTDSFTYVASDGKGGAATGVVTVIVTEIVTEPALAKGAGLANNAP